jgi:hypothetical protein
VYSNALFGRKHLAPLPGTAQSRVFANILFRAYLLNSFQFIVNIIVHNQRKHQKKISVDFNSLFCSLASVCG